MKARGGCSTGGPMLSADSLDKGEAARAERAERIAAMLDRWAAEDCSDEPDWDVAEGDVFRIRCRPHLLPQRQ